MRNRVLRHFRLRLANADSLLHFSALGILSGISCAAIILAFRFMVEWPSSLWLPGHNAELFEPLPHWLHFALPLTGAIIIGLILQRMSTADTRVGVPHVITQLHVHHGHMPLKNALVQFFAGALAIGTGQSAGREGPAIHLGAAANSLLGQKLHLPNNSIRVLVGCGTAAAIAASFNTPIAGVIFAMEVVMMEYTISGFTPVILAAVTSTVITQAVHGNEPIFGIPTLYMNSLWELPYVALLGLAAGACAALFVFIMKLGLRQSHHSIALRMLVAGLITGCCAFLVPEIMGIGYDSLNHALAGRLNLSILLAIIVAKLLATAASCGLGMPIGLIGPSLLIGACLGSAMGTIGAAIFPDLASGHSLYVMLGMGAMMGAVLNAPLAALMALLELSQNTNIIFPGMLAITIATLTNSEVFRQRSAHQTVLQHLKQKLRTDPVSLALQRTSVASIMDRNISHSPQQVTAASAKELLQKDSQWHLVEQDNSALNLIAGDDLRQGLVQALIEAGGEGEIDLLTIANQPFNIVELHLLATLREALDTLDQQQADTLYISGYLAGNPYPDSGVLTRAAIERYTTSPQ